MILPLAAALAIVVQDHAPLRAAPRSGGSELTTLWQGDLVEIRGERAGYLKVYDYRRERGGYMKSEVVRPVALTDDSAAELLAVLRFLRDSAGSEALGISYGAAYLKAAPAGTLTAEPFEAIATMAERLADHASSDTGRFADISAHLEVVEQFGIHMRSFERSGRTKVCYDGELYRRVLGLANATAQQRAHAALALTRPDCMDPDWGPAQRSAFDDERRKLLEAVDERQLGPTIKSRVLARRAGVWAAAAFEQARRGEEPGAAAQRAMANLLAVDAKDLGEDLSAEYSEARVRVGAIRWAIAAPARLPETILELRMAAGDPGQTCVALVLVRARQPAPLIRRCTYGIVWPASAQSIAEGHALVLAVQPLESWRELWVFRETPRGWRVDVLSPGSDEPGEGYIEYAGFAPIKRRLLVAREVKERNRFRRRFEELRLDDLALVRQASSPELLSDFGRWADLAWRRDTLSLR